jgi:ribonuclease HI
MLNITEICKRVQISTKEGFRYLGYQLKLGATLPEDWRWLVATFERRIDFWCNKWLSMGGRYILIKSVLESIAVFWMTLERVPKKVIHILRRLAFNFLWNGQARRRRFHLCGWETLSKPRKVGGWGLKNLFIFNTALLASSFWRAATQECIWHQIIADKYMGSLPFSTWIRKLSLQQNWASPFWKGLVAASPVILHWLRWKPGSGKEISLGKDLILGLEDNSLLSPSICLHLRSLNLLTLDRVQLPTSDHILPDSWLDCGDLSFSGQRAAEWSCFTLALRSAGITLTDLPDTLLWAGGDASGIISVKNLYTTLLSQNFYCVDSSWFFQIWKWTIPLKVKLFLWLAGKEKILTWDSLQRRGREGPSICLLCRQSPEDVHHLFIHCNFARKVWTFLLNHLSLPFTWQSDSLSDCFQLWTSQRSPPFCLAALVCWQLWLTRNRATFEDQTPSLQSVVYSVLSAFHWKPSRDTPLLHKAPDILLPEGFTLACFDGAAQVTGRCGAGGTFKTHHSRITKWYFSCGVGSNTKAELMGLWTTLFLASSWSIKFLIVLGDSRVVIDWINQKSNLRSVHIEGWKLKTQALSKHFTDIRFHHFSRSFNNEADALSKKALNAEAGRLSIFHSDSGIDSPTTCISIF